VQQLRDDRAHTAALQAAALRIQRLHHMRVGRSHFAQVVLMAQRHRAAARLQQAWRRALYHKKWRSRESSQWIDNVVPFWNEHSVSGPSECGMTIAGSGYHTRVLVDGDKTNVPAASPTVADAVAAAPSTAAAGAVGPAAAAAAAPAAAVAMAPAAALISSDVEAEEEEMVELPRFVPYPGMLVFPNLLLIPFWFFNTGLVRHATTLLVHQLEADNHEQLRPSCGYGCTLLAVAVLMMVACVLLVGLVKLLHFRRHFAKQCWKPDPAPNKPMDVIDPVFRTWSQFKMASAHLVCTPPNRVSAEAVHATFQKHDTGDGLMDASELMDALEELGVLPHLLEDDAGQRSTRSVGGSVHRASNSLNRAASALNTTRSLRRKHLARVAALLHTYDADSDRRLDEKEFGALLNRVLWELEMLHPVQRRQGKWTKPAEQTVEPARSERLLARPWALLPACGVDAMESMSFSMVNATCSARRPSAVLLHWCTMLLQVVLAVLGGMGAFFTRAGWSSPAQVVTIATIKLGWAAVLLLGQLPADGLFTTILALQFVAEGSSAVLVLLAAATPGNAADFERDLAFQLLLLPVFLPMLHKLYDGVIVAIILNCCRKKFSLCTALAPVMGFIMVLPSFVGRMVCGAQAGDTTTVATGYMSKSACTVATTHGDMMRLGKAKRSQVRKSELVGRYCDASGAGFGSARTFSLSSKLSRNMSRKLSRLSRRPPPPLPSVVGGVSASGGDGGGDGDGGDGGGDGGGAD